MPSIDEVYTGGGQYLTAADLGDSEITVTMTGIEVVELNEKAKLVASFDEIKRKVVINKTNAGIIAAKHGKDYDQWPTNKIQVILYSAPTSFQGGTPGIHVRLPAQSVDATAVNL